MLLNLLKTTFPHVLAINKLSFKNHTIKSCMTNVLLFAKLTKTKRILILNMQDFKF